jgi:hypothetical protein
MAFHFSPKIVTDGLVFMIDPGNRKSYKLGDTTIKDLVAGDIEFGIQTGNGYTPTFDSNNVGSMHFNNPLDTNGVFGYLGFNGNDTAIDLPGALTIDSFFKRTNEGNSSGALIRNGGGYDNQYSLFIHRNSKHIAVQMINTDVGELGTFYTACDTPGDVYELNEWTHVCYTLDIEGNGILYVNGVQKGTGTAVQSARAQTPGTCKIGGSGSTSQNYGGYISTVKLYNRALTPDEVLQNYNALKHRYGL